MMEIPVKFTIFPPVPLDSGIPFGLEVKMMYYIKYWAYYMSEVKISINKIVTDFLFSEFADSLQAQIDLFYKYCEIWNLIISIAKTKIVIYNQIYAQHSFSFTLAENTLEI